MQNGAMPERFAWVPDLDRAQWLRSVEAEPWSSVLSIVPRGFPAYARLFHPVSRDRPRRTRTWHGLEEAPYFAGVHDIEAALEIQRATWAQAAASFGTTMHAQAQYARLVRSDDGEAHGAIAPDGWRYGYTSEGRLDTVSLAAASAVLARHTTTPQTGVAAIWEGWGGLVSSAGAARFVLEPVDRPPASGAEEDTERVTAPSLRRRVAAALRQGFAQAPAVPRARPRRSHDPAPGTGALPPEIAIGPRFELHGDTGRRYLLFEAGAHDFADPTWPTHAPWVDEPVWAPSPSILWPDDHAWVLATEIDVDSTLVAGPTALVRDLGRTPGLEVLPLRTDADLTRDGDALNRPT